MVDAGEELEPLFDYHRVQPANILCLDDDDSDVSETPAPKRAKTSETLVAENADEGVKVVEVKLDDDDWLPPPPKVISNEDNQPGEDSTIKALRLKKQELLSFTNTAKDALLEVEVSAKSKVGPSVGAAASELPKIQSERAKIVISIQDKDGQKQFRVYADEKLERLFKMYADRAKLDPQSLVFCFDGDKVSPSATPASLGLEDDDMIEVHMKKS